MAILQKYLRHVYACLPGHGGLQAPGLGDLKVPGHGGLQVPGRGDLNVPGHGPGTEPTLHPAQLALWVQLERIQRPAPRLEAELPSHRQDCRLGLQQGKPRGQRWGCG